MTAVAQVIPTLGKFVELAKSGNVIPVFAEFIADGETPVSAFKKLDCGGYSFLFESTEKNDVSGRFSFIGVDPRVVMQSHGREVRIIEREKEQRLQVSRGPVDEVQKLMSRYQFVSRPELPRFGGGAVGFIGYEAIHFFEPKVPLPSQDELELPDALLMVPSAILIFDHRLRSLKIVLNAFLEDGEIEKVYSRAVESINEIARKLSRPTELPLVPIAEDELISGRGTAGECAFGVTESPLPSQGRGQGEGFAARVASAGEPLTSILSPSARGEANDVVSLNEHMRRPYKSNFEPEDFKRAVNRAKEYILAGDIFQVVLSQRFESPFSGTPLDFYRCLRFINPSPYMFCLNFGGDFSLVGSSPEMHVRLTGDTVEIRPIAGTRARGLTPAQDEANAAELLADPKERAEHIMLVDLARNDVGRVAEFGSVRVTEFMQIERYSHVMHIVSNVVGRLRSGCSMFDAVRATFPAGTVSGAPKIRAMQIISELEKTRRGCYAGAIGYFGFDGNFDSCIALRCAVLKNGRAYFQAGAGIVADSDPQREYEETVNKARAMMKALAMASQIGTR